jgi:NCAIR mutase (PurE)-related protein
MNRLEELLQQYREGRVAKKTLLRYLESLPYQRMGRVTYDSHREMRTGMKEVIYAPGKTRQQLLTLVRGSVRRHGSALVTRVGPAAARFLKTRLGRGRYHAGGRIFSVEPSPSGSRKKAKITVAVVTAGAADEGAAEEAALTLEHLGWTVDRLYDVGVAGIHRLLDHRDRMEAAGVIIVVAGMEGALASVVAGLTSKPVIAVPTSAGYGASFGGIAPLLTMLNSCAGGVTVVNIDSGFNAACAAHRICSGGGTARRTP